MPFGIRTATFADAKAIDALVAGFPELHRDLHQWVNGASTHIAAVDGDDLVGFAAKSRFADHPDRDLVAVHTVPHPESRTIGDALYQAIAHQRRPRPLKVRLLADDLDGEALAIANGFTRRITSATYLVAPATLDGPTDAIEYQLLPRDVIDAFRELYVNTHRWDPPRYFNRRHMRSTLLAGAVHVIALRDDDGAVVAVGAAHASTEPDSAADISLAGAVDPDAPDADDRTRQVLSALASFYDDQPLPLWFEADDGPGTNTPLFRAVTATGATPRDAVAVYTND